MGVGCGARLVMVQGFVKGSRSLNGDRLGNGFSVGVRGKGVGPSSKHELGKVGSISMGRDAKITKHSIRLPTTHESNGIGSTPAQSKAVAPPGRRLREERSLGSMPVMVAREVAASRRAEQMCLVVVELGMPSGE